MILKGDVNGDGRITIEDLVLLRAYLLNQIELTEEQIIAANIRESVNDDENGLSARDLADIRLHILGIEIITEVVE